MASDRLLGMKQSRGILPFKVRLLRLLFGRRQHITGQEDFYPTIGAMNHAFTGKIGFTATMGAMFLIFELIYFQ